MQLICEDESRLAYFASVVQHWQLEQLNMQEFALVFVDDKLKLFKVDEPKLDGIYVDFVSGKALYRRKFGGGKSQDIAKAIGLNKLNASETHKLQVLDLTAGLGRDAFVFASLGCNVIMNERNLVVAALLEDGLRRAQNDSEIGEWVTKKMSLIHSSGYDLLQQNISYQTRAQLTVKPDIIYIDPMYPQINNKKSTLVKKEMRIFHILVGRDLDADSLLPMALELANKRVVVKRPKSAPWLHNAKPSMTITMKNNRFDVYINAKIKA